MKKTFILVLVLASAFIGSSAIASNHDPDAVPASYEFSEPMAQDRNASVEIEPAEQHTLLFFTGSNDGDPSVSYKLKPLLNTVIRLDPERQTRQMNKFSAELATVLLVPPVIG